MSYGPFVMNTEAEIRQAMQDYRRGRMGRNAYYGDEAAIYALSPIELMAGSLPLRQRRLAEAQAELHEDESLADWQLLQSGRVPLPIAPL